MELNDHEFDAAFRQRFSDADPQFEEAAWDKMERKLKRRDRIVLFKNAALVLFFLLAGAWGYFSLDNAPDKKDSIVEAKKEQAPDQNRKSVDEPDPVVWSGKAEGVAKAPVRETVVRDGAPAAVPGLRGSAAVPEQAVTAADFTAGVLTGQADAGLSLDLQHVPDTVLLAVRPLRGFTTQAIPVGMPENRETKLKRNLPVSLSISAGPEFNSASSVLGGDPGFNAGLTLGFGISRRLDLLAGIRYSIKKYNSGPGVKYNFPGTSAWMQNNLTGLDATCNVLEIPVQASYELMRKGAGSLNLNAGVSSYLMLKEDYSLKYNSSYGSQNTWSLEKRNANRHVLSIVDLSATYFVKVQQTNLKVGLEPFVKIPLSGVGEGNINLKSSGISLKIRYDLDKKNN